MLSVIVPAFNEELSIERAYHTISEILLKAEIENEIIFIDDGSTDSTYEKINVGTISKPSIFTMHNSKRDTICDDDILIYLA